MDDMTDYERVSDHRHPKEVGIKVHKHTKEPLHWHIDGGPAGMTLVEAGWTEDMPSFSMRNPRR